MLTYPLLLKVVPSVYSVLRCKALFLFTKQLQYQRDSESHFSHVFVGDERDLDGSDYH